MNGCATFSDELNLGHFISVENEGRSLSVDYEDGKFGLTSGDTGFYLNDCSNRELEFCYYNLDRKFLIALPINRLKQGESWKINGSNLSLVLSFEGVEVFEYSFSENDPEVIRIIFAKNSLIGITWGEYAKTVICDSCFVSRITYFWSGAPYFWKTRGVQ